MDEIKIRKQIKGPLNIWNVMEKSKNQYSNNASSESDGALPRIRPSESDGKWGLVYLSQGYIKPHYT